MKSKQPQKDNVDSTNDSGISFGLNQFGMPDVDLVINGEIGDE